MLYELRGYSNEGSLLMSERIQRNLLKTEKNATAKSLFITYREGNFVDMILVLG